jgi:hypothetical protein
MNARHFWTLLTVTTCLALLIHLSLQPVSTIFRQNHTVIWWSIGLFIPLSIGQYYLAKRAAVSENKSLFHNLIIASVFFKMFLSVIILVIYRKLMQPDSGRFVLPFLLVYFIFTIFETYFMVKLAKPKAA